MIHIKLKLINEDIKNWCARNGYSTLVIGDVVKSRFDIKTQKEIVEKVMKSKGTYNSEIIIKNILTEKLLYKNDEEKQFLEDTICDFFGCIFYLIENDIGSAEVEIISSEYKTGNIISKLDKYTPYQICCNILYLKIVDKAIISDNYGIYKNIKTLYKFRADDIVKSEITKFAYGDES